MLFATTHANRVAGLNDRSNLTAQDIVEATHHMDFDSFAPALKDVYQQNKRLKEQKNERRRENRKEKRKQNSLLVAGPSGSQVPLAGGHHAAHDDDEEDQDEEDEYEEEGDAGHQPDRVQLVTIEDESDE